MKRRFNTAPILIFSLLAGLAGLSLQLWLQTGIDASGLLVTGHLATYLLLGLSVCTTVILFNISGGVPKDMHYHESIHTRKLTAFGSVLGAVSILITIPVGNLSPTLIVSSFIAAFLLLWQLYLQKNKNLRFWCCCGVTVFLLLLPLLQYPVWCVETQVQNYVYPLFACLSLLLAAYHRAEAEMGLFQCRKMVFFHAMSIYFGITCAATDLGAMLCGLSVWCAFDLLRLQPVTHIRMPLPEAVAECIRALTNAGFPAYAVGGCVRDTQLGTPVNDYDLCTSATPDQIAEVFSQYRLIRTGEKHGTVGVMIDDAVYEITTFRTEGEYTDNRHPNWVSFVDDLEIDLARRDFTINAMAYSPVSGLQDPWHGASDLKKKILRAVGNPEQRFQEDALRILRGVRFAIRFGLTPDAKTGSAMISQAPLIKKLARERIFDEMCKILTICEAGDLVRFRPIFLQVIPELIPTVNFHQRSPHHAYDVFTHTVYVVDNTPPDLALRWAALLHDVGKPAAFTRDVNGRGHFYGHADISAAIAEKVLLRLKAPTALREKVVFLIKNHMLLLPPEKPALRHRLNQYGEDNVRALLALQRADYAGKGVLDNTPPFALVGALLDSIIAENQCLHIRDLAVNGSDLMAIGFPESKLLGECLRYLLDCILDEALPNEQEALLNAASLYLQENL